MRSEQSRGKRPRDHQGADHTAYQLLSAGDVTAMASISNSFCGVMELWRFKSSPLCWWQATMMAAVSTLPPAVVAGTFVARYKICRWFGIEEQARAP